MLLMTFGLLRKPELKNRTYKDKTSLGVSVSRNVNFLEGIFHFELGSLCFGEDTIISPSMWSFSNTN